jgi:hypothetical protein
MKTFLTAAMIGLGVVAMGMILLLAFFVSAIYNILHRITKGDL